MALSLQPHHRVVQLVQLARMATATRTVTLAGLDHTPLEVGTAVRAALRDHIRIVVLLHAILYRPGTMFLLGEKIHINTVAVFIARFQELRCVKQEEELVKRASTSQARTVQRFQVVFTLHSQD